MSSFVKQTIERAIKSGGQAVVLVIGASQFNAIDADWRSIAGFAAGAVVLSVATSCASLPVGPPDSPSVVE